MIERIERAIATWLHARALDRAGRRFGGCQVCPWCKQWVQLHEGWHFDSKTDITIDALHCGNCGGVSRWRFELGMLPLDPIGLAPPPVKCAPPPLADDVVALVIAGREVWEWSGVSGDPLDKALEAFSARVPYDDEPEDGEA